jgi:DNA-binding LytR/AlgR family response regulator
VNPPPPFPTHNARLPPRGRGAFRALAAFAILTALALLGGCDLSLSFAKAPKAVQGVLDLRGWDFQRDGPVRLDGQWEFHWNRLLTSADLAQGTEPGSAPPHYFALPSSWSGHVLDGATLPGEGHASFRLRVLLAPQTAPLAMRLESAGTAYALDVDGRRVAANGQVGASPQASRPEYRSAVFDLSALGPESEWLLTVSNYHYRKGGPWSPLRLGTPEHLRARRDRELMLQLFLTGSLAVMGLYHLVLFAFRPKDRSVLLYGLFCFVVAARQAATGERLLVQLAIGFPWELLIRVEFISWFLGICIGPLFLRALYPREVPRLVGWIVTAVSAAATVLALVAPPRISSHVVPPIQLWTLLLGAYLVGSLLLAVVRRREGALVFCTGMVVLFATVVSDVLYNTEVHRVGHVVPIGLLVFTFSQALLLARRSARAFVTAETLQQQLEAKVEARTEELAHKNTELERTVQELTTTQRQLKQVGLPLRIGTEHHVFPYSEIRYLSAQGKKTVIHTRDGEHEVTRALKDIEPLLSTELFLRIHRQCIVNVEHIAQISHIGSGGYIAILRDAAGTTLPVSRYQAPALKQRLGTNAG